MNPPHQLITNSHAPFMQAPTPPRL